MKLIIASDLHGAASWCAKLMESVERESPDKVVLLGDLIYHGPRNDLPDDYVPRQVVSMLNGIAGRIVAVRGNCEAEVDQMVLEFPCMATYNIMMDPEADGLGLFLTHGHVYSPENLPMLSRGDIFLSGHTHVKLDEQRGGIRIFNPGSVGLPKDGTHSFAVYEDGELRHVIMD